MSGSFSKNKGISGENKAVLLMESLNLKNPRRGPSQRYGVTDADVLCDDLSTYWTEVKNGYSDVLRIYDFLGQAEKDSEGTGRTPIVLYKGDYKKFLVIADATQMLPILSDYEQYNNW